jgi:glycosyltransferase involved in cell wall biosynthesis
MKVGIYQRVLLPQQGGEHTFESEVISQLAEFGGDHDYVSLVHSGHPSPFPAFVLPNGVIKSFVNRMCSALDRPTIFDRGCQIGRLGVKCIYSPGPVVPCFDLPYFVTCWDLQHRLQPFFPEVSSVRTGLGSAWDHRERHYRTTLQRAAGVITGTTTGKQEITRFYGIADERVHVIPFFVPSRLERCESTRPQWLPEGPYFVYPAQFWPHKNHATLIRALRRVHELGCHARLVLPGLDKPREFGTLTHVKSAAKECHLDEFVLTPGFIPNSELRWLYENAVALTFVSHFGPDNLPPLEAFSLSCPVIAADVAGAREQLGDAAILVPPTDVEAMSGGMVRLLVANGERSSLISAGRKQIAQLTIRNYVSSLIQIFDQFESIRSCWP